MPASSPVVQRSRAEWVTRAALAAVSVVAGYAGVTLSLALSQVGSNPGFAHRLAPHDGQITGRAALSLTVNEIQKGMFPARGMALARRALQQDPYAVAAAVTLGISAESNGEVATARRFFAYAQSLTRRDRRTQLWAIEDAVRRNNIPDTLHQYDISLRTMPRLAEVLYPVLAQASADGRIRRELVHTLAKTQFWRDDFVDYVSKDKEIDPTVSASLIAALHDSKVAVSKEAQNRIINELVASNKIDVAWDYYVGFHPGAVRTKSRDPHFAGAGDTPSQFDWVPIGDDNIVTGISSGAFDFTVSASVGGTLLRQMQLLPPGNYRMTGSANGINQAAASVPYWSLSCQNGSKLGIIPLPNSADNRKEFSGSFTVPSGCPIQILSLVAQPSDAIGGSTGQINGAELVPVQ